MPAMGSCSALSECLPGFLSTCAWPQQVPGRMQAHQYIRLGLKASRMCSCGHFLLSSNLITLNEFQYSCFNNRCVGSPKAQRKQAHRCCSADQPLNKGNLRVTRLPRGSVTGSEQSLRTASASSRRLLATGLPLPLSASFQTPIRSHPRFRVDRFERLGEGTVRSDLATALPEP